MEYQNPSLYVVDDSLDARGAVAALASSLGFCCKLFDSAEAFLDCYAPTLAGCALVDIRLKKMNGVELLETLAGRGSILPVILVSAYADVPLAVRAMQDGALTLIEKPYDNDLLIDAIRAGFQANAKAREALAQRADAQRRIESLSPEERRLMDLVIAGHPNKAIAQEFGSCRRTVERMRAKLFQKMGVASAVELPQIVFKLETGHTGSATVGRPAFERVVIREADASTN